MLLGLKQFSTSSLIAFVTTLDDVQPEIFMFYQ